MEIDKERREAQMLLGLIGTPPARILEVGCGSGRLTKELATGENFVLGIDPDRKKIAKAVFLVPRAQFMVGTLNDLDDLGTEKRFNLIVFSMSLHHIGIWSVEKMVALDKARSLLVPGGRILIIEPALESQITKIVNHCHPDEKTLINETMIAIQSWEIMRIVHQQVPPTWHYDNWEEFLFHFQEILGQPIPPEAQFQIRARMEIPDTDINLTDIVNFFLLR